jgi:hypothetical protein
MGTISKMVQHRKESIWQKQRRVDTLMQLGLGDTANYCGMRDMKYGIAELLVPAVVKPQTDMTAATALPTTFGELMQSLDLFHGQSQMLQGTSGPGSSQMRLGSEKPQSHKDRAFLLPDAVANSSPTDNANNAKLISFDPSISRTMQVIL